MKADGNNKFKSNIPNIITVIRIIGAMCILFIEPLTVNFFIVYALTGVTDVLDGWLARRMKVTSMLGARLDSIADLLFYSIMVAKIFPTLLKVLPLCLWICIWSVVVLRGLTYLYVAIKYRGFSAMHTYMNKLTGGLMFLLPCLLNTPCMIVYSWITCVVAFLATAEEMLIHIIKKTYDTKIKSIFLMKM